MQEKIVSFLKNLRCEIIKTFETLEPTARFEKKPWKHHSGGGGEIGLLRGEVFEKAAVNWSGVSGKNLPTAKQEGPFFATGVSLITHMRNPRAPTAHMNIRFIQTKKRFWFGGGYDLTPMGFPFKEDTEHFHSVAKNALDPHGKALYTTFSKKAKEYFFIKHRKKERGVGGIFFDHYDTGNFAKDFLMWQTVGTSFLNAIMPIYSRRIHHRVSLEDREKQCALRAHYVEYNLLYDRGTQFGFLSGGNPEAILCSMPPVATW